MLSVEGMKVECKGYCRWGNVIRVYREAEWKGVVHVQMHNMSIERVQTSRAFCFRRLHRVIGAHLLRTSPTVQFFFVSHYLLGFFCASQRITPNMSGSFWLKNFKFSNFYHIPHDAEAFLGSPKLLIPKTDFSGPPLFQATRAERSMLHST